MTLVCFVKPAITDSFGEVQIRFHFGVQTAVGTVDIFSLARGDFEESSNGVGVVFAQNDGDETESGGDSLLVARADTV